MPGRQRRTVPAGRAAGVAVRATAPLARLYLTLLMSLIAWAVLPVLLGWESYVVQSDSMAPAIRSGDILVSASVDPGEVVQGQVVLVDDPAVAGRVLSHRVVGRDPEGALITKGDANAQPDSTPVREDAVRGLARLRVPLVGLPSLWAQEGVTAGAVVWGALTALAVWLAAVGSRPPRRPATPTATPTATGSTTPAAPTLDPTSPDSDPRPGMSPPRRRTRRRGGADGARKAAAVLAAAGCLALAAGATPGVGAAHSAYATPTSTAASWAARPDFVAPTASAVTIAKTLSGYLVGSIRPSATYRAYAAVTDTGNPASGVGTVVADLSAVTSGQGSASLTATPTSLGGVAYDYQSGSLTAGATTGTRGYSVTLTDAAANSRTLTGYTVDVDGTAPTAADVDGVNKAGGTVGRPESGDSLVLTFSEQIDPFSLVASWVGTARTVTLRFTKSGASTLITLLDGTGGAQIPVGTVTDPNQYFNGTADFTGSTLTQSGSVLTVVLGTPSSAMSTVATNATLSWAPVATPYDAAGNAVSTTVRNEQGAADPNF